MSGRLRDSGAKLKSTFKYTLARGAFASSYAGFPKNYRLPMHLNSSEPSNPPLRVSVLHWNRPVECLTTVAALKQQYDYLQITVLDNNSEAEKLEHLKSSLPDNVELIRLSANVGWGRAHNVVLQRWLETETTEFCIVSAHDSLPQPGCLASLIQAMCERPKWGMASPEYGNPELPSYSPLLGARIRPCKPRDPGTLESAAFCFGTLVIFRRECLRQIGLFDEKYFAYGDEAEIALRARHFGWETGIVWGAVLINPGSWSTSPVIAYLWTRNTLRLARAFGGFPGCLGRAAIVLAVTLRERFRGSSNNSINSPKARWLGIRDYFRGYYGPPPANVLSLRK